MKRLLTTLALFIALCPVAKAHATATMRECHEQLQRIQEAWRTPEAAKAFDDAGCDARTVYCVDPSGYPVPEETKDPNLSIGETLTIRLFGPDACLPWLTVTTHSKQLNATLFPRVPAAAPRAAPVPIKIIQLANTKATPDENTETLTIFVARKDLTLELEGISIDVIEPGYYLDVGVLAAFTPWYQQVSTSRAPGMQDQFIRETNTIHPAAAITLNYFPFKQYSRPKFTGIHGLGVLAGIGGNFSRIDDEFYLGLLWEAVPGAGISTGVALLEMQKLHPNYPAGALVQPNDVPKDSYLGPRWYFGIALDTQVFQTILRMGASARVPSSN